MDWVRQRLSYANVTATAALFIALGGSAYATHLVGTSDLMNGSVTAAKLARSSVDGSKVRNHSLTRQDFAADQLKMLQGAPGPAGPPGAPGTARAYATVRSNGTFTKRVKGFQTVSKSSTGVYCLAGDPGIDSFNYPAVATADRGLSAGNFLVAMVRTTDSDSVCPSGQYQVNTFKLDGGSLPPSLSDAGFTIMVP